MRSPWIGVGFPNSSLDSVDADTIQDNLITESWYLNSAVAFGVPYVILWTIGLFHKFYFEAYRNRTALHAILVPLSLIDLVYGGAMEGLLYWSCLWCFVSNKNSPE
jgi:hypothetical protein